MKRLLSALILLFSLSITPAFADLYDEADKAYEAGDYEKAKSILLPLAEGGNADAMNLIGFMYDEDKTFSKNEELACDWYEKAAKTGYDSGTNNYGLCFEIGSGRARDMNTALLLYEKTAANGDLQSQITILKHTRKHAPDKARFWGQKAVDQGSALARVAMWGYDLPHTGRQASFRDITCVFVMIGLLNKEITYCD